MNRWHCPILVRPKRRQERGLIKDRVYRPWSSLPLTKGGDLGRTTGSVPSKHLDGGDGVAYIPKISEIVCKT